MITVDELVRDVGTTGPMVTNVSRVGELTATDRGTFTFVAVAFRAATPSGLGAADRPLPSGGRTRNRRVGRAAGVVLLDTGDGLDENGRRTGLTDGLDEKGSRMNSTETAPTFADLSRDLLETADLEVVTSLVELPPSFQLPTHRHPGEEFAYVIDGAIYFWQYGVDGECHMPAGSFAKVPLRAVHSVRTGEDQGAKLIVFRVHTPGSPERELVDLDD